MRALGEGDKEAVLIGLAHAAGDIAVLGQRVFQQVARHGKMLFFAVLRFFEKFRQKTKALSAIVVVGIDDGERPVHDTCAAENRVSCAPRLFAPFGNGEACGQAVKLLENILDRRNGGNAVADVLLEFFLDRVLDHKNDLAEARFKGIVDGIVDDKLAGRTDRGELFQTAEATAHARRPDD